MSKYSGGFFSQVVKTMAAAAVFFSWSIYPVPGQAVEYGESVAGKTVKDRVRPETDPDGVPFGGMTLYPSLAAGLEINSNIFALDDTVTPEISDILFIIEPGFVLRSNWSNHQLEIWGRASIGRYDDITSEDYEDYDAGFTSRWDIKRWTNIKLNARFQRLHEDRGSPDDVGGFTPTEYDLFTPEIEFNHTENRVSIRLNSRWSDYDFDNNLGSLGIINNDDRDRTLWVGTGEIAYGISSGVRAFVEGLIDNRDYDLALDDNGFNRDSSGYGFVAGLYVELTGKLSARGSIGYRKQTFDDPALIDFSGVVWGLDAIWQPSGMTTITLYTSRTIEETTLFGSAAFFAATGGIVIDHEFLRNLIGSASFEVQKWDYQGIARQDDLIRVMVEMVYMMNRHLWVSASFTHVSRDSNLVGQDYKRNMFLISLTGAF
ncbi:MAG: outer membrane beta-barrel protein [Proteobacteria bacterium]|nr:outer membrane beta-barrel protein [Pseudomonadota bacterium]